MDIRFRCPHCRQKYSVDSAKAGHSTKCHKCENTMVVPAGHPSRARKEADANAGSTSLWARLGLDGKFTLANLWQDPDPFLLIGLFGGGGFFLLSLVLLFVYSGEEPSEPTPSEAVSTASASAEKSKQRTQPTSNQPAGNSGSQPATPSRLELALRRGTADDGNLVKELHELGTYTIRTQADAAAICETLQKLPLDQPPGEGVDAFTSPLAELAILFQRATTPEATRHLTANGLPILLKKFDEQFDDADTSDDLLDLLYVFAMYQTREGADRVILAARQPLLPDHPLWTRIMRRFDTQHLQRAYVMEQFHQQLPSGRIAIDVLVAANRLAAANDASVHPFDSDEGVERLKPWLSEAEDELPNDLGAAFQAAAAIPHLAAERQKELLDLALAYPNWRVQVEAAWSAAKLDDPRGVEKLAAAATEVRSSPLASTYLRAIGREDAIPTKALDPEFLARADMTAWLTQHHGQAPEELKLVDHRTLIWPPVREERELWLFRYRVPPAFEGGQPAAGLGLVGSETAALPKYTSPNTSPEDAYALHSAWELIQNKDPRAPAEITPAAGREALMRFNPGFGKPSE